MDISTEGFIEDARKAAGQSVLGLSTKTGIPRQTLTRKLQHPQKFTIAEVTILANALHADPAEWITKLLKDAA